MNKKLYYWGHDLDQYSSDNVEDYGEIIEIKRLNFFIGKNNSGKSRFLRNLFISDYPSNFFRHIEILKNIKRLKNFMLINDFSQHREKLIEMKGYYDAFFTNSKIGNFNQLIYYISKIDQMFSRLPTNYRSEANYQDINFSQDDIEKINDLFQDKFYIPTLRGMRPVTDINNKQPYLERAQKDYFQDKSRFNAENIITGECLYYELKIHLLGKPEQRELIKKYEEKLSQYFFDNDVVTLIPMFGKDENGNENDVVHIKIGDEEQFPIYKLGDGLQQAIIMTYEDFIKKDKTHAFFIEEPELHMHAGMVRQLMNFYLNETQHYYFFTTHSNHLLDMVDESDQVTIQKIIKVLDDDKTFSFKIYNCDKDHELLTSLGVRPSSVYLANCTIWVEGVTDRMYLSKLMDKYLKEIEFSKPEKYKKYKSFMPNFHYTFIEYAGGNITHWSFIDDYPSKEEALKFLENSKGLTAKAISKNILLLADGDNEGKAKRLQEWESELKPENVYILPCKEIENTLDSSIIHKACLIKFQGINKTKDQITLNDETIINLNHRGFTKDTSNFDIDQLNSSTNFISSEGIGKIIDEIIIKDKNLLLQSNPPRLFSDASGTIDDKVSFCEICKILMTYEDWVLTEPAKELCEKIFKHIEACNT
ncbi:ATP-binding protein [Acinetobacter nosocomialis]|uniref:ATP-binding protein n=1 Tax=Acinetobacter nosocomialis TaxID=106654 RepID=UPI000ED75D87|nr:ATP-binding protein [Acinetobacter nosocomialis]MCU4583433.1 ATP-binding protein [Acinetobacter nosocomialis]HAM67719.1 AAA family ATPase [Acinetobacter nosocomialis]